MDRKIDNSILILGKRHQSSFNHSNMGLGIFRKLANVGRRIGGAVRKALPVAQRLASAATPLISTLLPGKGAAIMGGINTGLGVADRLLNRSSAAGPPSARGEPLESLRANASDIGSRIGSFAQRFMNRQNAQSESLPDHPRLEFSS